MAAENSDLVAKKVKELAYGLRKVSEDLEEKKDEMDERSRAIAQLESEIPRLKEAEADSSRLVKSLETDWKDYIGQREDLGRNAAKIPLLKQEIGDLQEEIQENEEALRLLEAQLAEEIDPLISGFEARPRPSSDARGLDARLSLEKEKLTRLEAAKQTLESDLAKTRDLITMGVCPLCGQRISGDLSTRIGHSEQEHLKLEQEMARASESVNDTAKQLEVARHFEEDEKDYARAVKDRERIGGEIKSLRRKLQQSNGRLSRHRSELAQASSQVRAVQELSDRITDLESRLKQAREDDRRASLELNRARTELADASRQLERLSAEVKQKQEALDEARRLTGYQDWLSSFFRPTVELIEKQTLTQAAARFNEHFQRFFTSLVDDPDMVVRVKEDFSPLFEREGFEQDYEALSGGERTSMALAYRFALNSVVRESASTQPELVILDEPTDGFSKEQVYKMRGLLEELDSRQVILVSHEKELESMADHIFRVEKRNGTSVVSSVQS